jgi:hypothetical protein
VATTVVTLLPSLPEYRHAKREKTQHLLFYGEQILPYRRTVNIIKQITETATAVIPFLM